MAELLAEDRKDFMKLFLIILGINILIFLIVFVFCACKVASLCDKEMEKINKEEKEQVKKEKRVYKEDRVFNYGDKVNHEIYGDGVVIEVTNTILTVAFNKDVGIKKILKNHKSIRRV